MSEQEQHLNEEEKAEGRSSPQAETKDAGTPPEKNKPTSFYSYLLVLFGAAFLMLLLAYFVQQRNNAAAMDDLRSTMNLSREELVEEIQELETERDRLQAEVEDQKKQAAQKSQEVERLNDTLEQDGDRINKLGIKQGSLYYLWYIQRFMEEKDYPMAAAVMVFSADPWRSSWNGKNSLNPALLERYDAARQELIRRGYLQQLDHVRDGGTDIWFGEKWNPGKNHDAAALSILWCALDAHFALENDHASSQYLSLSPLGDPASGYQERVERQTSDFTLQQFQLLKNDLVESKWLTVAEDGSMGEGFGPTGFRDDILYNLPFQLPEE